MLRQVTLWVNSKGGCGKSTHCAHHAVLSAASGWRVLTVDADLQGNLADALGYARHDDYDGGENLLAALEGREALKRITEVRPGLDCVGGGPLARGHEDAISRALMRGKTDTFERILAPVADDYDLILIDLPPNPGALHTAALATAHFVILPAQPEPYSLNGIGQTLGLCADIRSGPNPDLEVLGIVLGLYDRSRRDAPLAEARRQIHDMVDDLVPILEPVLSFSQAAANHMTTLGVVATEYEDRAVQARKDRIAWLRQRRKGAAAGAPASFSVVGERLAGEYQELLTKINALICERQIAFGARVGA